NDILADFDKATDDPAKMGRTLLIELLAWQFASPVRWIETQDLLLSAPSVSAGAGNAGLGVERFVEIGVGSFTTLAIMLGYAMIRHDVIASVSEYAMPNPPITPIRRKSH